MPTTPLLGSYGDISNRGLMFRNVLINGGFDIWQRGTSQTSSGYGSDDRWQNTHGGSTKTASQQTFTVGQTDVPGNPRYWARTVVTSSAGSGNYVVKSQFIESVTTLSGQTATLSFWAKADASKNIAIEFAQRFGSGGSPSAEVSGIGITTCALTTAWKYFTVIVNIPSISGKILGTANDHNLALNIWFDAGSTFNARTNSLGQQSGTFDIANVQLEAGPVASPFEQRPIGTELGLCQRYYYARPVCILTSITGYNNYAYLNMVMHPQIMRASPVITFGTNQIFPSGATVTLSADGSNNYSTWFINTAGTNGQYQVSYTASAEL